MGKSIREIRLGILLFGGGLFLGMGTLTAIIPQMQGGLTEILDSMPFARTLISTIMGIDVEEVISMQIMNAFVWVHPVNLSLVWAAAIVWCTRVPCAEIERGTIDILLGWPVSRRAIAISETLVWGGAGAMLIMIGAAGHLMVQSMVPGAVRVDAISLVRILVNLYTLYLAVAGLAWMCSCMMDRRAIAIGTVFGVLLASFLINFIAQAWPPAGRIAFLSVLQYYQPAIIVRSDQWPVANISILMSIACVTWLAGTLAFERRQIRTT